MNEIRKVAIDNTIENLYELDYNKPNLINDFIELEFSDKLEVFRILRNAFKNVIEYKLQNSLPIAIPYIGRLRIKETRKIALKVEKEVLKKYDVDINNVDKETYNNIKNEITEKTVKASIEFKKNAKQQREDKAIQNKQNQKPVKHRPRVLTFKQIVNK